MSYTVLAALAVPLALVLDRWLLRTRLTTTSSWWLAYAIVVVFQLLTNGWLTGRQIVRYDGSAIIGSEFTNTSITCNGDGSEVAGSWQQTHSYNPHVLYNSNRRGYIACTATPETMRADFKIFDRVSVSDSPERTGGSLVVEAGKPGASAG